MKYLFLLLCVCLVSFGSIACSEEDIKETVPDVLLCVRFADRVEECVGWDTFGINYAGVMSECIKAAFDAHDACLFECLQYEGCVPFGECIDGC